MKKKENEKPTLLLRKITFIFNLIGSILGIILMILMIFALSAGVISRYGFNRPIFWVDEFARIVLIWTIFIGAALALKKGSSIDHISIDFFVSLLPTRLRKVANEITWSVIVFFCIAASFIGIRFLIQTASYKTAALGLPKGIIYINLPIFAIMSLIFLVDRFLHE